MDIAELAINNNGYVSAAQATLEGIPRRLLSNAVADGELVQIERGLYALPDSWEDELYIVQHRFARGIFSDETALYLHGMTDRAPFALSMTFPRSYNAKAVRESGVTCRTCANDVFNLGKCEATTQYGNTVMTYSVERTLCDIVRGKKVVDKQVVVPAMKAYASSKNRDINKLIEYARKLGVETKIRSYMEVLL